MTGFEYTAAVHMLYEGQRDEGLRVIEAIRARYDGQRRSPFDEAECGHHYARAMASWAAMLALTGFHYSGGRAVDPLRTERGIGELVLVDWGRLGHGPTRAGSRRSEGRVERPGRGAAAGADQDRRCGG